MRKWWIGIPLILMHLCPVHAITVQETFSFGSPGSVPGYFRQPAAIASEQGSVLVVDSVNRNIQRFTRNGTFEYSFQPVRDEDGEETTMDSPSAVAVASDGTVYVVDEGASVIYVFDRKGRYIKTIGGFGAFGVKFNQPRGIATDVFDNLYVADAGNNRVLKLNREGRQVLNISFTEGNLHKPSDVFVTAEQELFVLDQEGIKRYDELGKYHQTAVTFAQCSDFTIDEKGRMYLADRLHGQVRVYSAEGDMLVAVEKVKEPVALVVTGGFLYVADSHEKRIRVFEIK